MAKACLQPDPLKQLDGLLPCARRTGQFQWQHDIFQRIEAGQELKRLKHESPLL